MKTIFLALSDFCFIALCWHWLLVIYDFNWRSRRALVDEIMLDITHQYQRHADYNLINKHFIVTLTRQEDSIRNSFVKALCSSFWSQSFWLICFGVFSIELIIWRFNFRYNNFYFCEQLPYYIGIQTCLLILVYRYRLSTISDLRTMAKRTYLKDEKKMESLLSQTNQSLNHFNSGTNN